jgi:hypothetical protein
MTVIEIKPHRWGWKVFEAPGVEPVFPEKAMGVLQSFTASQLLPFVEAATKAKLTGSIETQPGDNLAALSAFCI